MQERQSFDYPSPQMGLVLQHFYEQHPEVVDRAGQEFFAYVQVTQERVPKEKIEQLFNEWLAYDFRLKTGKTALETYIYRNPDELDAQELDLMQQANDSSYVSHFWIEKVDTKSQMLTLRECSTDAHFEVRDATASQSIEDNAGLVAARLIRLDGCWYFASDPIYFLPIPSTEDKGQSFIDVVKLHYGIWAPPSNSA
ncbi:MAG: hypothetical protein FWC99_04660 [Coriobacteriia bacterium]|nr:hypothetical protein [Coriobacteriia bacterium]